MNDEAIIAKDSMNLSYLINTHAGGRHVIISYTICQRLSNDSTVILLWKISIVSV